MDRWDRWCIVFFMIGVAAATVWEKLAIDDSRARLDSLEAWRATIEQEAEAQP